MEEVQVLDPETEFIASKQETGNEWELFKENVRPLKRGRNIQLLNHALKSQTDYQLKISLLENRRRLIEAIDEYKGDDPLHPWLECIKWVQESFPPGGDCSGLVVIYEQCVRTFWHSDRYKDDARYLKVWLEYAENCADAEVIYSFLDANEIGKKHSMYYISYALHLESKNKMKDANDIFNLGISRNAQPIEKLKNAYKKFLARSMRRPKVTNEDSTEHHLPVRSFGTILTRGENRELHCYFLPFFVCFLANSSSNVAGRQTTKKLKPERAQGASLLIYRDKTVDTTLGHEPDTSNMDLKSWRTLGARNERNKENNALPAKWTSYKVPQRPGSRTGGVIPSVAACIEVFVDEECA